MLNPSIPFVVLPGGTVMATPPPPAPPPRTPSPKRERLRELMADCPACSPEEADDIADEDLDRWIKSHGGT